MSVCIIIKRRLTVCQNINAAIILIVVVIIVVAGSETMVFASNQLAGEEGGQTATFLSSHAYPPPSPPPPPTHPYSPILSEGLRKPATPMALRTSGHLLVGLSRIYAKKVIYLLSDSTETLATLVSRGKAASAAAAADLDLADESGVVAEQRVTRERAPAKDKT